MNYIFDAFCIVMIVKLIQRRKIDFFFVGAVCFMVYNIHCRYGVVFISSHEHAGSYYYWSPIIPEVYFVVLSQMVLLFLGMLVYDHKEAVREMNEEDYYDSLIFDEFTDEFKEHMFKIICVIAWVIMIYNVVFKIGISNLTASKSLVWKRVDAFYLVANWMGMASYTYALREKKWLLALFSSAPVLLHFFIGSRAYLAVLIIIFLSVYSYEVGQSIVRYSRMLVAGGIFAVFMLAYKRMYELIKVGEFGQAFAVLLNPDTYAYISRMGEPRIVLANLNYIIDNDIVLGFRGIVDRLVFCVPFLEEIVGTDNYTAVSSILASNMNSSYGLASNMWGEFYALGSYGLIFLMFVIWIKLLGWGNHCLKRNDWSSNFVIPMLTYTAFYVHRLDFVKLIGNYKKGIFAMLVFAVLGSILSGNGLSIKIKSLFQ